MVSEENYGSLQNQTKEEISTIQFECFGDKFATIALDDTICA